jgi:O-methyltransferase
MHFLQERGIKLVREVTFNRTERMEGRDWPLKADTMIGIDRLNNLQACLEDILKNNIEGDVIETGVWRGGAVIFMKAVLTAYGDNTRTVWVADSFEGLPMPDPEKYPVDKDDTLYTYDFLRVSQEKVQANFEKYGLMDEKVKFLKGWFKDTLPNAPIKKLALMRLDGDMYESTMDSLNNLYPKLSVGGYVLVDDFNLETCVAAVHDFRAKHNIVSPLQRADWASVFWQKQTV